MRSARFDWYQATIPAGPDEVSGWLLKVYPDGQLRPAKPRNGAGQAAQLVIGEMAIVTFMWGGAMDGYGVNAWASGVDAHGFAEKLRESEWRAHRVTRADVALDFDSAGAWNWAYELLRSFAERFNLETEHAGDYHRGERGRSFYVGGRKSVVRVVAYEKGRQIPELGMPDLVRIELRVRPKDRMAGYAVSSMAPEALFGCSVWSSELGGYLYSQERFSRVVIGTRWTKSDRERAISALVKQYGGKLGELCSELGGWAEVGEYLGEKIRQVEESRESCLEQIKRVRSAEVPSATNPQVPEVTEAI